MQTADPGMFEAIPVSDKVNAVANVGPELVDRVEPAEASTWPKNEKPAGQLTLF
jgi:hypothetical protein